MPHCLHWIISAHFSFIHISFWFQIVNVMNTICQQCINELEIAHTFKLKCDKLNYHDRDAAPKQELCEMCGQIFRSAEFLEQHRELCRKTDPRVNAQTHNKQKAKKIELAKPQPRTNAAKNSSKSRTNAKSINHWKVERLERSGKVVVKSEQNGLVCPYCRVQFMAIGGLQSHIMWHRITKFKHKCSSCELSFINDNQLRRHATLDHWNDWVLTLLHFWSLCMPTMIRTNNCLALSHFENVTILPSNVQPVSFYAFPYTTNILLNKCYSVSF